MSGGAGKISLCVLAGRKVFDSAMNYEGGLKFMMLKNEKILTDEMRKLKSCKSRRATSLKATSKSRARAQSLLVFFY